MKIGIVNDTEMAAMAIAAALSSGGRHDVVWTARSGEEALGLCRANLPDLVLMDLVMPGMNGVETTRRIMASTPTAILVVTASVEGNCSLAFQAMGEGALDAIATPALAHSSGQSAFLNKISQIGAIVAEDAKSFPSAIPFSGTPSSGTPLSASAVVAIGSSAGGPAALAEILEKLPPKPAAAIVIIQHIDVRFVDELAAWLNTRSTNPVQIVREGDTLRPGIIYLAGKDGHLEALPNARLHYTRSPINLAYQPSVDVFFSSVARVWGPRAMGVILTGMGRDGAVGLKTMRDADALTVAQDRSTCALYGMPKAAALAGAAAEILPLQKIQPRISRWIDERK